MGNQQLSSKDVEKEKKDEILTKDVNLDGISHKSVKDIKEFASDIHKGFKFIKDKYNLNRDAAKNLKRKIFNRYEQQLPEGFKVYSRNKNYMLNDSGEIRTVRKRNVIKQHFNKKGYLGMCLGPITRTVHRCVAETFVPNDDPKNKTHVNHKDGCKVNNNADNLEWVTPEDNTKHAVEMGLFKSDRNKRSSTGEFNNSAKLTEAIVKEIRADEDTHPADMAVIYGVTEGSIRNVLARRTWKHI